MQATGARIWPVNPLVERVLGERSYASLAELPERPELVNVFRLPRAVPGIVDEMIALGLTQMWVQQGIVHEAAAAHAEAHGIDGGDGPLPDGGAPDAADGAWVTGVSRASWPIIRDA